MSEAEERGKKREKKTKIVKSNTPHHYKRLNNIHYLEEMKIWIKIHSDTFRPV